MTIPEKHDFLTGGYRTYTEGLFSYVNNKNPNNVLTDKQTTFLLWIKKILYLSQDEEAIITFLKEDEVDELGRYIGYIDYILTTRVYREVDKELLTDLTNLIQRFRKRVPQINKSYNRYVNKNMSKVNTL